VKKLAIRAFHVHPFHVYIVPLIFVFYGCEPEVKFQSFSLDKKLVTILEDKEFSAALINDMETKYSPAYGIVADQMTLREKPLVKSRLKQVEREKVAEVFTQGHDGEQVYQEFDISAAGKLDLMIIIDNSGSMGEEQAELSENLKALTLHMDNVDWQIGVLTTDLCNLQNARYQDQPIKKGDADAFINFEQTVKGLGTSGSRDEMGIKMAMLHLNGKCPRGSNRWLRSDAVLGVFFVSDEQNECDLDCKDEKGIAWGPNELIALMKSMRKPSDLKAYSLLWNRDVMGPGSYNPECRRDSGIEAYGSRYSQVVQAFSGIERSICLDNSPVTNDYIPLLELVSKDVSRVVRNEFTVQSEPIPGTMTVSVDGMPASDAVITGRKIVLKNARGDQGKLQVSYRTGAVARFNYLMATHPPAPGTIQVFINGASDDQYDVQGNKLTFNALPPDRAEVKLVYRKDTPLLKDFFVGGIPVENQVKNVWVEGQAVSGWIFSAQKRIISLPVPPLDGENIEFAYLEKAPKITSYKLPVNRSEPRRLHVYDPVSGQDIPVVRETDTITFDEAEVEEGRQVVIEYNYGDQRDVLSEELPHEPLDGQVSVSSSGGDENCVHDVVVTGRTLAFQCQGSQLGEVLVKYQYVAERYSYFKLDKPIPQDATILVFVDRSAIKDFTIEDGGIRIPERYLNIDSKIRLVVSVEGVAPQE